MAELNHFYAEGNTAQTTTTGGFNHPVDTVDGQIDGADLLPNTKYLVIARALFGVNSTTNKGTFSVETDDDDLIQFRSETKVEMERTGSTELKSFFFVHSFTTSGTPADVLFKWSVALGSTMTVDQYSLLLLDLDDLGSGNYFETAVWANTELSTTTWGTTLASLTDTDLGTDEEWLVLGSANINVDSASHTMTVGLHTALDAASTTVVGAGTEEGEDGSERRVFGFASRHKAVTSVSSAALKAYEQSGLANHARDGSYIIALKTSAFADFESDIDLGAIAATSETTIATVAAYTPTVSGNHLIIGMSAHSEANYAGKMWLEDDTTETRTGDSTPTHSQRWDTVKDFEALQTMQRISISAEKTYNLKGSTAGGLRYRNLLVLNLNLAPTGIDHTESVADAVGVTDQVSRVVDAARTVTDPVGATDVVSRVHDAKRTATDDVSVIDGVAAAKAIKVTITDVVGVADQVMPTKTIPAIITDPVGIADQTTRVAPAIRSATDPVGVTDVTSRLAPSVRVVVETVAVQDQVSDDETNREQPVEVVGVTDDTDRVHDAKRIATEPVGLVDNIAAVKTIQVTISDDVGVSDTSIPSKSVTSLLVESAAITDSSSRISPSLRTVTEVVGVTDLTIDVLTGEGFEIVTEPLGVTDTVSPVKTIQVTVTESIDISDITLTARTIVVTVTDDIGVTDQTPRVATYLRTVTDPVGVTDDTQGQLSLLVTWTDSTMTTTATDGSLTTAATDGKITTGKTDGSMTP